MNETNIQLKNIEIYVGNLYIYPIIDNQEIWKIIHQYFEDNPQSLVRTILSPQ